MELYIIRHGIAQERTSDRPDQLRSLTAQGQEKTRQVAKKLYSLGLRFDLIMTSPLVRSRQTAEILVESQLSSQWQESIHLAPDGNISAWLDWLEQQQYPHSTKLAIVGHEPNLGQWASMLIGNQAPGRLVLKKAGIIGLTLPETGSPLGRSQMFWLTPPKFLVRSPHPPLSPA